MLISWFNRLGCEEFRKHNMANLFVQMKDVTTYKGKSDVNQWTTEFPLKLQVIKQFETEMDYATPVYGGSVGVQGVGHPLVDRSREAKGIGMATLHILSQMAKKVKDMLSAGEKSLVNPTKTETSNRRIGNVQESPE